MQASATQAALFEEYSPLYSSWVSQYSDFYKSDDLVEMRRDAVNAVSSAVVYKDDIPELYYKEVDYIQISDCMEHTVPFNKGANVFVDVFCGKLIITGDVAEVNVIENHGTVRVAYSGVRLEWATAYQQFGKFIIEDEVERVDLYNLWMGSSTQLAKVYQRVTTIASMPRANLEVINCTTKTDVVVAA